MSMTGRVDRVDSPTERSNPNTVDIDLLPTEEILRLIQDEDALVPAAVTAVRRQIGVLVDEAVERIRRGGRVHYFGAGTSGRLAVLDAAELLPTYGVADDVVVAHQAGGDSALVRTVEGAEDDAAGGADEAGVVGPHDVVLGLAASGRTPYVRGALQRARSVGAYTAVVTANPAAALADVADLLIVTDTGPEVVTGSTRMKAGTALKLVLHAFSTALMIRLGHTYSNLMVGMRASNAKLRGRVHEALVQASGVSPERAAAVLAHTDELKTALVALLASATADGTDDAAQVSRAAETLRQTGGDARAALERLGR